MLFSSALSAGEGSICVSPVEVHPKYKSGSMEDRGRTTDYEVRVGDSEKKKLSSSSSTLFTGFDIGNRYLVKIYYEGTLDQSFWHEFKGNNQYCLWYKSLYFTWSVWPQNISAHLCACGVE